MKLRESRRGFIRRTAAGLALVGGPYGAWVRLADAQTPSSGTVHDLSLMRSTTVAAQAPPRPPALAPSLVQQFVQKAHGDLPETKAMLADQTSLLNATWDWGGGDFEAGIGGAGHMGNREIAEFLIAQGARIDIFVAAMLGKLDIVQAMLAAWPALIESKGPHGISLLRHARAGGDPSLAVVDQLLSRGAK